MEKILKSKKFIFVLIISIFLALIFSLGGHSLIKHTSDDKFCVLCHEWMNPMVETYHKDPHGGNNENGIKASCVSCHLPHDSLFSYLFQKGKNGIAEVTSMIVNDPEKMDWQKHREKREKFVFDSGCIECHTNITTTSLQSKAAKKMHEKYEELKDNVENPVKCVTCHVNVGHSRLGKKLYDRTHEPIGEWEEDK